MCRPPIASTCGSSPSCSVARSRSTTDAGVAAIGESAVTRAAQLAAGRVDDIVLHDVDGRQFSWRAIGPKKKVLVTWASW